MVSIKVSIFIVSINAKYWSEISELRSNYFIWGKTDKDHLKCKNFIWDVKLNHKKNWIEKSRLTTNKYEPLSAKQLNLLTLLDKEIILNQKYIFSNSKCQNKTDLKPVYHAF